MKKNRGRPRISNKEIIVKNAYRYKEEIEITKRIRDKKIKGLEIEADILYEAVSLLEDKIEEEIKKKQEINKKKPS
jgi:hypothetical protein